jgi:hypothetical protein
MPHITTLARLQELRCALESALRVIKELAVNKTLVRLAASDPQRWNFLLDSLAAGMESGEQGSMLQVLTALDSALED